MLPYETERHAKTIFSKWLLAATNSAGSLPSDTDADLIAQAAVRMAQDFSRVAEKYAESAATAFSGNTKSGIRKSLTFEELVDEWQGHTLIYWRKDDRLRILNRFRRYLYPSLASRPVEYITTPELIPAFQAIEDAGYLPLAHLILRETIRVFRFAIASGYALNNPAVDVRAALYPRKPRRRTTILLPKRVGELLRAIDGYHSVTTSGYMLRLLPLVFVRPGELRQAEWTEVDFKSSQWRIPARRMKARRPHIVPLSRQAARLFRQVHRITGNGRYVFRVCALRTASFLSSCVQECSRVLASVAK